MVRVEQCVFVQRGAGPRPTASTIVSRHGFVRAADNCGQEWKFDGCHRTAYRAAHASKRFWLMLIPFEVRMFRRLLPGR